MYRPYCQMHTGDHQMIDVAYDYDKNTNKTIVCFEKPDEIYGFKTFECELPSYEVLKIIGFNEADVNNLLSFCRDNAPLLLSEVI